MKSRNTLLLFTIFSILSFTCFSQDDCVSAINVPTLDGTNCPSSAPSSTNFLGSGGCEEGTLDTWFQFTAQGTSADITISSTQTGFRPEFLVVSTTNNLCTGGFLLDGCFDQNGNYTTISGTQGGLTIGDSYWIVVSSHNNNTSGTITVCVDNPAPISNCVDNEDCGSANVVTLSAPDAGQVCLIDCNTGASAGLDFSGTNAFCEDQLNETVWYEFTTDALAATIDIDLSSTDLSEPEYALYQGTTCISPWTLISCSEGTGGAASIFSLPIAPNTTYVLAISDASGDEGDFTLCLAQHADNSACNTNAEIVATSTSMGSPLDGPYLPGEVVSFCYTINGWIANATGCNYLQGIVPTFGDCWDAASFDAQGQPTVTTALVTNGVTLPSGAAAGSWVWQPAGTVDYNLPGPSNLGLVAGDDVGAGWFFTTTYQAHGGDPDFSYGDHDICTGAAGACAAAGWVGDCEDQTDVWTVCFELTAKGSAACVAGEIDCAVNMKTYADGEVGVWTNIGCSADLQTSKSSAIDCLLLPAELISFTGTYTGESVRLEWTTASEKNTYKFTVLHSVDSENFTEVGEISAAGNSQSEINYSLDHTTPASGNNYYALIGVDFDGEETNHGIISVKTSGNLAYYDRENQTIILSYSAPVEIYGTDGVVLVKSSGGKMIPFTRIGVFYIRDSVNGNTQKIVVF
ncbi:MAG: hypothetical protein HRT58_17810 [Crocinitomicaceae bacterium]|nr:hypothetical protein [Flavobacteriales bacterium]NQZ37529.1 hypothetical protein [Crocinitomicaceae bacterium]